MTCPARIRPFPNVEITDCELPADGHTQHKGTLRNYAYPGSVTELKWLESDRRTFTGEWIECPIEGCLLPSGHPRDHS